MNEPKTLLLTGGTGSFGQTFVRTLLRHPEIVSHIRVFSRDEHKQSKMKNELNTDKVSFWIGDIRDFNRINKAMEGCHYVVHAAALKTAPLGEVEPQEFIHTNINGSENIVNSALDCNIERCLLISTDKAVEPINLYGATKMCAERLFIDADRMRGNKQTRFACTRYGNVAGSRSTVVPIFMGLSDDSPTPITEPESTRFWITLPEANQFVLSSLLNMRGGEIMFPRLKSAKILDVAEALRPGKSIKIIGHRNGDKLHEVLTVDGERYCSGNNEYMTVEEIRRDCDQLRSVNGSS